MNRDEARVVSISGERINGSYTNLADQYARGIGAMCGAVGFALGVVAGLVLASIIMMP
jgi:hypothetical protein